MLILDILLAGLVVGGAYALVAMGLTLQYGIARIMNLAHGEVLVAACFATWATFTAGFAGPLATLALVVPAGFAVSWLVYRGLLTPLVRRARSREALEVDSILATFGLLFVIQGAAFATFGGDYYSYSYLSIPVSVLGSTVAANRLIVLAVALAIAIALYLALTRTRAGTALRAVGIDPTAARLVAIDVERAAAFAFALGGALCAAGGVLVSMFLTFNAAMGVAFTMKALIVVIMGGIGNLMGALAAGLMLGLVEAMVARLVDPGLTLAANYALFLAVLLARPTGLFGRPAR